ncbi:hypothetical protein C8R46DRAFT_1233202 [Mycena filopes]|nr:hypothetical protein C8R46DRAFT_1233202 [Mycena filopes]
MSADNSLAVVLWLALWNPGASNPFVRRWEATDFVGMPRLVSLAEADGDDDDELPELLDDDTEILPEGAQNQSRIISMDACFRLPRVRPVASAAATEKTDGRVDLQKGEHFANMDYFLSPYGPENNILALSYDIGCQFVCHCTCHKSQAR